MEVACNRGMEISCNRDVDMEISCNRDVDMEVTRNMERDQDGRGNGQEDFNRVGVSRGTVTGAVSTAIFLVPVDPGGQPKHRSTVGNSQKTR